VFQKERGGNNEVYEQKCFRAHKLGRGRADRNFLGGWWHLQAQDTERKLGQTKKASQVHGLAIRTDLQRTGEEIKDAPNTHSQESRKCGAGEEGREERSETWRDQ